MSGLLPVSDIPTLVPTENELSGFKTNSNKPIETDDTACLGMLIQITKFKKLYQKTIAILRSCDASFPELTLDQGDVEITHDFFGEKHALFTKPGMAAVDLMNREQGIKLEGAYTGKALSALIHHVSSNGLHNEVILFWNTYNAIDFSDMIDGVNYKDLPESFHQYFEKDVQPLDKVDH